MPLYDMLLHLAPSPISRLHRAVDLRYVTGAEAALGEPHGPASELDCYHLYHAARAELLRALGQPDQVRAANQRALELTSNPAEQVQREKRTNAR